MKVMLYIPLLTGFMLGAYTLVSQKRRIRKLWQPMQILLLCGLMAISPRDDLFIIVLGASSGLFAFYVFVKIFGLLVVGCAIGASSIIVALFPEFRLWFVSGHLFILFVSHFAWALAVRKYGKQA